MWGFSSSVRKLIRHSLSPCPGHHPSLHGKMVGHLRPWRTAQVNSNSEALCFIMRLKSSEFALSKEEPGLEAVEGQGGNPTDSGGWTDVTLVLGSPSVVTTTFPSPLPPA